jgi:hypothetical protein
LYSFVGFFGYKGLGSNIRGKSMLGIFSLKCPDTEDISKLSPELKVLASLRMRYGEFLGSTLPMLLCYMFIPIFFVGIVSNMFSIIPVMQNVLSRNGKQPSRRAMSMLCCMIILLFGIFEVSGIDKVLSIFGYLLTTPISFLFPSLFVLFTSRKMNLMTISSSIMMILSGALMIGLLIVEFRTQK